MKLTRILAAAAAPLALGGVLLVTAGQASAAVTPAVLTASVTRQAPVQHEVRAFTFRDGVEDTTSVSGPATVLDPVYGPVWAHDYIGFEVTAAPVAGSPGTWNITIRESGVYVAFASPLDGTAWTHTGVFTGHLTYQVTTAGAPSARNLPATEPGTMHTGSILTQLFGGAPLIHTGSANDGRYSFTYYGVHGAPGGVYTQAG
jgi:hypothetical protein